MELHSDQGRNLQSRNVQKVLERRGVRKTTSTPLHPQSDGMVERNVWTIEELLRKVVSINQRDWDERLALVLLAYWASTHETTGVTPANLVFGREHQLPCDLIFGAPPVKGQSVTDYAANLPERLRDTHNFARQHLIVASDRMKARYDQLTKSAGFKEGTQCGYTAPSERGGSPPTYRHAGKVRIHKSPASTTLCTGFRGIPG